MPKKNKLEKYFEENNSMMDRFTINSKITNRIIGFIICSVCYPLLTLSKRYNTIYGDEVNTTNTVDYIRIIMICCYVIAGLGFLYLLLELIFPNKINKLTKNIKFTAKKTIFNALDWLLIIPICCNVAIFMYSYLFIINQISGTSMMPTIENSESVFVSYLDRVDRFEVVIAKITPEDNIGILSEQYYIKRVIGMPGDRVTWNWSNNTLKINGKIINESYFPTNYLNSARDKEKAGLSKEQINRISETESFDGKFTYKRYNKDTKEYEIITTTIIPDGYYFVMGDNRNQGGSKDSRVIGLIPSKNIIGVAKYHVVGIIPWGKIAKQTIK